MTKCYTATFCQKVTFSHNEFNVIFNQTNLSVPANAQMWLFNSMLHGLLHYLPTNLMHLKCSKTNSIEENAQLFFPMHCWYYSEKFRSLKKILFSHLAGSSERHNGFMLQWKCPAVFWPLKCLSRFPIVLHWCDNTADGLPMVFVSSEAVVPKDEYRDQEDR